MIEGAGSEEVMAIGLLGYQVKGNEIVVRYSNGYKTTVPYSTELENELNIAIKNSVDLRKYDILIEKLKTIVFASIGTVLTVGVGVFGFVAATSNFSLGAGIAILPGAVLAAMTGEYIDEIKNKRKKLLFLENGKKLTDFEDMINKSKGIEDKKSVFTDKTIDNMSIEDVETIVEGVDRVNYIKEREEDKIETKNYNLSMKKDLEGLRRIATTINTDTMELPLENEKIKCKVCDF